MIQSSLLSKAYCVPLAVIGAYVSLLSLLIIPAIQRELIYLHHLPQPLFPKFDNPERYGLAPYKTRNFNITTSDGERLGAWHILPTSYYRALDPFPPRFPLPDGDFEQAFKRRPTILYFHGNAGSRAATQRVRTYSAMSTHLDCNVLVIDYRGFADSSGRPSEYGLLLDARAVWDYVISIIGEELAQERVILVGQSLGTGVVAGLAGALADEGESDLFRVWARTENLRGLRVRALILMAPYTSIAELLSTYRLFRFIPSPLKYFPGAQNLLRMFLLHPFESQTALAKTSSPTLFLHAFNDETIPPSHSSQLFHSFAKDYHESDITEVDYPGWGVVRSMMREGNQGEVIWWEGLAGGHNGVGWTEGTLDLIARVAKI